MSRYVDIETISPKQYENSEVELGYLAYGYDQVDAAPFLDIVFCEECKHRPIKEDVDGENYGFNLIGPTDGDERCPCLVSDGWYSWMPEDDFYCGYGER